MPGLGKLYLILVILLQMNYMLPAQIQKTDTGTIDVYRDFKSQYVTQRNIEVWLPSHFEKGKDFSVLYMHDGQMLYDSSVAWNGQSWNADYTASALMKSGKIHDIIIVGIWNTGKKRHYDYFPEKPFFTLSMEEKIWVKDELIKSGRAELTFQPNSDDYLKCIVQEIKPFIDSVYQLKGSKDKTFIAGSSMGGLISMYAIFEYPEIFQGAACLSTHWPGVFTMENNPVPQIFTEYMKNKLPGLTDNKLYFDCGNMELDSMYPPLQKAVDEVMAEYPQELKMSLFFEGEDHSETAWKNRFETPLLFLFKK
jgi:predicted alpha/beta superfamily hydrolase